jgi:hypothetical protein
MCDFRAKGIHAASFNSRSLGIEVLGDYDIEDPNSGRGLACWTNTAETVRVLLKWLGIKKNKNTILFHRDDPKTKKSCPGKRIDKQWFLDLIPNDIEEPAADDSPAADDVAARLAIARADATPAACAGADWYASAISRAFSGPPVSAQTTKSLFSGSRHASRDQASKNL